ncbi:hypothetical protein ACHAXR_003013, partial [Thalassiosira sp. AJA248-18]
DGGGGGTAPPATNDEQDRRALFVNPSTIDAVSARKIKEQKGGLGGFVERQVKMVIDMLTLKMVDFELRVVLPPQPPLLADADASSTSACNKVLMVGGDKIEVLSYGRDGGKDESKLKQRINLHSFVTRVYLEGMQDNEDIISYPLVEPFSYSADVSRVGERFGGFMTGLEVLGLGQPTDLCPDLASITGSGLSVHLGSVQIDSLMLLSVMMLAPPNDNESSSEGGPEELENGPDTNETSSLTESSSFTFPLSSAKLILFEETSFLVSGITMRYMADGTICSVIGARMQYESSINGQATASQVEITMRPSVKITVGCLESLQITDTLLLSSPIQHCEILYEGSTMIIGLDTIDVVTFSKKEATQTGALISMPSLPCNVNLRINKGIQIKKSDDGSMTKFGKFNLFALKEDKCTKVAVQFESFRNYLVSMTNVSFCGSFPKDQVDTINDFNFTAGDIKCISGYSTDEWSDAFQPRKQSPKHSTNHSKAEQPIIKLPLAKIANLKIVIGMVASHKIRVKDTAITIKAYEGKLETSSNDVIRFYTKACLSRAPDFISNAEVLGLNVVDSTAGLLSTWAGAGLGFGSAFGAGTGVAAITAVDAIKGAVDAGKRSRNSSEEEDWKPGDFLRGVVQAAGEATRDGAAMRGRTQEGGNIIDWAVGATSNSTDY